MTEKTYRVDLLTRVEGEGRFFVRVKNGEVVDAELSIFEAPRFFEAFLRGRSMHEVVDIVARICGICPVAYQESASVALERALGVSVDERIRKLRRLIYCGEWMESHALHVFLLHAPDYLGYPDGMAMARDHRDLVERGLRIKRTGNRLIELLGGRAIHPVSLCVGGFSRVPRRDDLAAIRLELEQALDDCVYAARWSARLSVPEFDPGYVFVAADADEYPLETTKRILVSGREPVDGAEWESHFREHQVPHSNALHCRLGDGSPYLCGPLARLFHHAERLHPVARQLLDESGVSLPVRNPFRSIFVRSVELVHACAEAMTLIDDYSEPREPHTSTPGEIPTGAQGWGATEAPRGLLFHRYTLDEGGLIQDARIVPPTSQNQARIEADLRVMAPNLLDLEQDEATQRCEQLIRAYDPCISCATHFLRLQIEREDSVM